MGKQINYYMGVNDFRQLAQYALDIGCVICKQENTEIVRSNSVDIVIPDYKKYFFICQKRKRRFFSYKMISNKLEGITSLEML